MKGVGVAEERGRPVEPGEAGLVVDSRRMAALGRRLAAVRARIAAAAAAAGRDPAELTLIAVSKTRPAEDVLALCLLGVRDFAENRGQEAGPKVEAVRRALSGGLIATSDGHLVWADGDVRCGPGSFRDTPVAWRASLPGGSAPLDSATEVEVPDWHFIGQLQRNKARAVVGWAHCVQSVDRVRLVESLSRAATESERRISVCIQVSLDDADQYPAPAGGSARKPLSTRADAGADEASASGRGGARPAEVPALAERVAASEGLLLAGVMAVAPRGAPPRPAFTRLREVAERLRRDHPSATVISAGMSGDLEAAVVEGTTHLRIGTALFGERHGVP